jgi:hypothetical protein
MDEGSSKFGVALAEHQTDYILSDANTKGIPFNINELSFFKPESVNPNLLQFI